MTCLPVTVRSVQAAVSKSADAGGDVLFYGVEPGMLVLVGFVESLVRQGSSLELLLNDSTGRMKVKHFTQSDEGDSLEGIAPGRYVTMYGQVRTAPAVHFAATGLRLVQSADEVSYHMIESAHAALKLEKEKSADPPTPGPKAAYVASASQPMALSPPKALPADPVPNGPLSAEGLRDAVVAFFTKENAGRPEGMTLATLFQQFPSSSSAEVRKLVDALVSDGEVYTTIDDDHFAIVA